MTPQSPTDPLERPDPLIVRFIIGPGAVLCLGGLAVLLLDLRLGLPFRPGLMVALGVLSALCWFALRLSSRRFELTVTLGALAGLGLVALEAVQSQWGINSAALGYFALATVTVFFVAKPGHGLAVAAVAMLLLVGLAGAEQAQWLRGADAVADLPLARRLFIQILVLVASVVGGMLLSRVRAHFLQVGQEREHHFRSLLAIAADAYWEMDAQLRITRLSLRRGDQGFEEVSTLSGIHPWDAPELQFEDELQLDAHLADLESREPFRDLQVRWASGGKLRHLAISGEPRFGARGAFLGFWGVVRDFTDEVKARAEQQATETRYLELFTSIPTPLLMHRRGRIIDANPAALLLFGFKDAHTLIGQDLLPLYEPGESRVRAGQHLQQLEAMAVGQAMPPAEFRMHTRDGRCLVTRAAGVRVDAQGGPATLSIYVDDTQRKSAEEAVRRSEAMLSHLVATSPDLIMLTDLAQGRFAMVNAAFTQLTGYAADEVIGRTAGELGVWRSDDERARFADALRETGRINNAPFSLVTKSGRQLPLLISAARFVMDGRDYVVTNARDISAAERSRLEREAILDNASIGIAFTRDQVFVQANGAFEQMLGWQRGSLVGQPGRVVWACDQEYVEIGALIGQPLSRGEACELERELTRRDGATFWCRILVKAVDPTHPTRGGTIWIVEDITERRRVEQALAKARDDAEAANRAKSAFLANTSHEIRTPLNGLVGLARLARQPEVDEQRRRQYLEQISDSAQTLSAVISDILDLSKIEAGKLHVEAVPFDLHALLHSLQRGYGALADVQGLALSLAIDDAVPARVVGDPLRVRQILGNFLSNALKFTPRGTVRIVAHAPLAGRLRLEVHDTGPGLDAAMQARLFRPFTQADQSTTRAHGGTGLGLAICRELAALMHGGVGVVSAPGQGSCFWAELALPPTDAAVPPSAPWNSGRSPLTGTRILLVDDNPVNMMIAVALLAQWGAITEQATDGAQAVAAVDHAATEHARFDAVLMDLQMPVMSGHEAARILRTRYDARTLPIIALTAAALVSERDEALAAGMNDFLTKPIDAQHLYETLTFVLSLRNST